MAVDSMNSGAFDFLIKPFDPYVLLEKVEKSITLSEQIKEHNDFKNDFLARLSLLTEQEDVVCKLMLQNKTSREIAESLGNSTRTIEVHRANILKKMGYDSLLLFAQQNERFELFKSLSSKP